MRERKGKCREERNYVESAVRAIRSRDLLKRWKQLDSEPYFVPGDHAKHKAPRDGRTGVQGTVCNKMNKGSTTTKRKGNDGEKNKEDRRETNLGQHEEERRRTMPDCCGCGRNPRYDSDDANFDDSYTQQIDPEKDYQNVPMNVENRQINELQRVEYFTIGKEFKTQGVSVCQGCVRGFKDLKYFESPNNLVFQYKMYRMRPTKSKEWINNPTKTYCYFHAEDMFYIRNFDGL